MEVGARQLDCGVYVKPLPLLSGEADDTRLCEIIDTCLLQRNPFDAEQYLAKIQNPAYQVQCKAKIVAQYDQLSVSLVMFALQDHNFFNAGFHTRKIQDKVLREGCEKQIETVAHPYWDQFWSQKIEEFLAAGNMDQALFSVRDIRDETLKFPVLEKIKKQITTLAIEKQEAYFKRVQEVYDDHYIQQVEDLLSKTDPVDVDPTKTATYHALHIAAKILSPDMRAALMQKAADAYHAACKAAIDASIKNKMPASAMAWVSHLPHQELQEDYLNQVMPAYLEYCQQEIAFYIEIGRDSAKEFANGILVPQIKEASMKQIGQVYDAPYIEKLDALFAEGVLDEIRKKRAYALANQILSSDLKKHYLDKIQFYLERIIN